ncbi:MAG TPA: CDP-alcohol phosphatidyltransferase family protein [Solirubrobacteraceae bacterium]|nr:CDP-alcohol phosphatidyltransferase family protein [Solirubrobacteraceae bacterium]
MNAVLPWLLIAARAAAALVLAVALAARALSDRLVLWLFVVAFVSDYFDGVIARALNVVTRSLRQADSVVDTVFYLVLAGATSALHPEELRRHAIALGVCLGTLAAWYALDLIRWRAAAGFHSWSAKLFAATLGLWAVAQYGFGRGGPWLVVACAAGTLSHLEGIAISLVLRRHVADVPTVLHALRLRAAPEQMSK